MTISVNPHPQIMCDTIAERDSIPPRTGIRVFCRETDSNFIFDGTWKAVSGGAQGPPGERNDLPDDYLRNGIQAGGNPGDGNNLESGVRGEFHLERNEPLRGRQDSGDGGVMISIRKADPQKDLKVIAPMVNAFAEEIGLDDDGSVSLIATIPGTVSFIAYKGNDPVGVLGMVEAKEAFWGQYIWVDPEYRGGVVAGFLHKAAFLYCEGKPARIVASEERKKLYEKIGYSITHYVMERAT